MNDPHLLGKILIDKNLLTAAQVQSCIRLQTMEVDAGKPRRLLGDILLEQRLISRSKLEAAVAEQRKLLSKQTVGPYRIVDKLGQGGMGAVYRAEVPDTGIEVALKLLPKRLSSDPNFLNRFHREATVGRGMDHPHIVRTVDFGESKGIFYLAMEVVEGGTLEHHLIISGTLPERTVLKIARDILSALQYAAEKGLVHRDIKPSNILFDHEGRPKLSDFGLAKDADPELGFMTDGTTVGTPHYMAPEQARGDQDIDVRADLYSLGATLYHCLTGRTPFTASSTSLVMHQHLTADFPAPETLNKELSSGISAVVKKLMARDRRHRYQTPAVAAEDIQRVLRGETPQALNAFGPRRRFSISSTSARRRRRQQILYALFAGAGIGGLVMLFVSYPTQIIDTATPGSSVTTVSSLTAGVASSTVSSTTIPFISPSTAAGTVPIPFVAPSAVVSVSPLNPSSLLPQLPGLIGIDSDGSGSSVRPRYVTPTLDFRSSLPKSIQPGRQRKQFDGFLTAPVTGRYGFILSRGGRTRICLNDTVIVQSDEGNPTTVDVVLGSGVYSFHLECTPILDDEEHRLRWRLPGSSAEQNLPAVVLTHAKVPRNE